MSKYPFWKTQKNLVVDDIHYVYNNCEGKWYYTKKPKGVRAIWTGEKFIYENGDEIVLPEEFVNNFPKETAFDGYLDGEMYYVYDVPQRDVNFEERLKRMNFIKSKNKSPFIIFSEYHTAHNIKKYVPKIFIENNSFDIILTHSLSLYLGTRVKHTIILKKNISTN